MSYSVIDTNLLFTRLKWFSDCDFHLQQTSCCKRCFVEDYEMMTAFFDANDLTRTLLLEKEKVIEAANRSQISIVAR